MSRIRTHSVLFLLLLIVLPAARGQTRLPRRATLTAREIAKRTLPSVVVLFARNPENRAGSGTGFFVDTDIIATNYHVVRNASEIYAKSITRRQALHISEVIQVDEKKDL